MATILSSDSIETFLKYLSARGRSDQTIKAYRSDLEDLLGFVGLDHDPAELEDLAADWLTEGRKTWRPNTTSRKRTSVRAWAAWAGQPKILHDYLLPDAGKPNPHPIPEGFDGITRMIEAAEGHPAKTALVALSGFAGLRIGEILSVTVDSFDLIERRVTVTGKGDRTRSVPLAPGIFQWIMPAIAEAMTSDSKRIVPYKDRWARQVFTDLGAAAGLVRRVASHDGRATFATNVYREVKDLRVVQELLGHADSSTTEIYTEASDQAMRAAVTAAVPS